jgi:hypothetical protein
MDKLFGAPHSETLDLLREKDPESQIVVTLVEEKTTKQG